MASPRPCLGEMTWQEVRDAAAARLPAVIGIDSTEQHGPHLPLNTDAVIPLEIALAAAQIIPLVVTPPIRYGAMSRPPTEEAGQRLLEASVNRLVTAIRTEFGQP